MYKKFSYVGGADEELVGGTVGKHEESPLAPTTI